MLNLQMSMLNFIKLVCFAVFSMFSKNSSSFNSAVHHVPIKPVIFSFKVEPDQKSNGDSCGYEGNAEKIRNPHLVGYFYLIIAYYICLFISKYFF